MRQISLGKKGMTWTTIGIAILALVALVIAVILMSQFFGKSSGLISTIARWFR